MLGKVGLERDVGDFVVAVQSVAVISEALGAGEPDFETGGLGLGEVLDTQRHWNITDFVCMPS